MSSRVFFEDDVPSSRGLECDLPDVPGRGSATDAEEVLQDAWLRWQDVDRTPVGEPDAYMAKIVTNLSIRQLTSARAGGVVRREWLLEPC